MVGRRRGCPVRVYIPEQNAGVKRLQPAISVYKRVKVKIAVLTPHAKRMKESNDKKLLTLTLGHPTSSPHIYSEIERKESADYAD